MLLPRVNLNAGKLNRKKLQGMEPCRRWSTRASKWRQKNTKMQGENVVIYKGRVISEGLSSVEAVKNALKKHPHLKPEDLEVAYVPFEEARLL